MKNKKLLIGLLAGILLLAAVVTGILLLLGGTAGDDPTENTDPAAQVTISQASAEIGIGGKLYLTAQAVNTQEPILWASSDPSVALVQNGEVTGIKEGTTVISASAGTAVAECTVTVSMDAPVLVLNQEYVAVAMGDSYTLRAEVLLKGAAYTAAPVTYQWTAAEGSDAVAKLEVSGDGSEAVVTGVAYGETEYYVTTTVKGVTLTKKVTLVCCNTDITFGVTGEGVEPAAGGFLANVELGTSVQPAVTVFDKEQPLENAQLVWTVEDESIATVSQDGKITAVAEGYTVITCKYGEENNTVKIFVNVYRPVYQMDTHYNLETALGSLTLKDKLAGSIKGATLDGKSIFGSAKGSTLVFKKGTLPSDPEIMGQGRELVIHTTKAQYVYTVSVYSKVITTAEQFQNMQKYLTRSEGDNNWAQYTGYLVLGNDIDLAGASFEMFLPEAWSGDKGGADNNINSGFNGIFDGRGYSIKNYVATAGNNTMFTTIGKNGVIQNVSFTDIVAPATTGNILSRIFNGTMKDVYISVQTWENGALLAHSYRNGRFLENVVVEYTGAPIEGVRDITGHWGTPPTYFVHAPSHIQNVYVIGNITEIVTNCAEHGTNEACGFHVYKNLAQMKADKNDYSSFSADFWNMNSGVPTPTAIYSERAAQDITVSNTEKIMSAGDKITLLANVDHVTWRIASAPAGVTLKGNVLTVGANAGLGEVKVVATNVFNSAKKATYTFQIVFMTQQKLDSLGDLELNDTKDQTTVTLDLSGAAAFTGVEGIKIGDKEIPVAGVSGTDVTIATEHLKQFLGRDVEIVLTCKTADGYNKVTAPAFILSKVLETAEDVQNMTDFMDRSQGDNNWTQYTGYLVLGRDIDLAGASFELFLPEAWSEAEGGDQNKANMGFNGTLDGRGHTLKNYVATAGHNTWFTVVGIKGLIQNVSFTDIVAPGTAGNILTRNLNGTMKDVYISLKSWENGALLAHSYRDGRFLENVVIEYTGAPIDGLRDLTGHWGEANYFVHFPNNIKNVYIIGNIKTIATNCEEHNADGKDDCGFHIYKNLAQMKADKNDYSSFSADFWNLSSGVPTPKALYAERTQKEITVSNTEKTVSAGDVITLLANVDHVTWSLVQAPAGVTLKGNVLTIGADAALGQIKVVATNVYNTEKTADYTLQVVSMTSEKLEPVGDLELNDTKGQTTVTLDLSGAAAFTGVEGIKIGDKEIPVAGVSGTDVTVATEHLKQFLGKDVEIVLTCKTADGYNKVTVPAFILSKVLETAEDVQNMTDFMDRSQGDNNWAQYTGYLVLGKDIDLAGASFEMFLPEAWSEAEGGDKNKASMGFNGTLDGRGYSIKNYVATAGNNTWFTVVGVKGLIQNVSITDIVAPDTAGNILTRELNGTFKNVYISLKAWDNGALLAHSYRDGRFLENVVIEYTGAPITDLRDLVGHWGATPTYFVHAPSHIQNVFVIGNIATVETNCGEHGDAEPCGFHIYKLLADMKSDMTSEQLEAFGGSEFWSVQCGVPVPAKLFTLWSASDVTVTNNKVGDHYELNRGSFMELSANVPYVQWELVGNTDSKVTLVGNKLTAAEDATAAEVVIKATNIYNAEKTVQITVQLTTSVSKELTAIEQLELMGTPDQTHVYIDLEETESVQQITGVTVNGNAAPVGTFALEDGSLKLAVEQLQVAQGATVQISYKTENVNVVATSQIKLVVTKIIRTFADLSALNSVANPNLKGYFVLGNDINAQGQSIAAGSTPGWVNTGFQGIFDGQNYTISNLNLGDGEAYTGIFGTVSGATIKNVTFDKVTYGNRAGLFGRFLYNLAGTNQKTTIENVTVNVSGWTATGEVGIFSYTKMENTKLVSVVVNVADGVTVTNLLGGQVNLGNVEGDMTVNLGRGSDITYYNDSSTTKPTFVTVTKPEINEVTDNTPVIGEGSTTTFTNDLFTLGDHEVIINGISKTVTVTEAGKLTLDLAQFGKSITTDGKSQEIVIVLGSNQITYTDVLYVTQVINTVDELKALGAACEAAAQTGYYILGGNIDCSAAADMAAGNPGWQANGFRGTFDGRGYTVSNIKMSNFGGLFGNVVGATIKNVIFDGVDYAATNATLLGRHNINIAGGANTTIENVTVNISGWSATGEAGVFASRGTLNTLYNNVTINVADGLTIHNLLGQEWDSNHGSGITVNLGVDSRITAYYWSSNADTTAVATAPAIVTVYAAVAETVDTPVYAENTTSVTFSNPVIIEGEASVTINGVTKPITVTEAGTLSVDLADFDISTMGAYTAKIAVGRNQVNFTQLWYVTRVIDTVEELKAFAAEAMEANTGSQLLYGYYILGGNIDCEGASIATGNGVWNSSGFMGTLDGRDYKIQNLLVNNQGGIFGRMGMNSTVKNIHFENTAFAANSALFAKLTYKSVFTNVTVDVASWVSVPTNMTYAGILGVSSNTSSTFTDVVINVADGVSVSNLLGREFTGATGNITVNLGAGSEIVNYYTTDSSGNNCVTTLPSDSIITVNTAYVPVQETVDSLVAGEGTTSVTFTHDKITAGQASISIDGGEAIPVTAADGSLTADFSSIAMGQHTVVITTPKGDTLTYTNVWYVTQVINDVAEFTAFTQISTGADYTGYYVLGANINMNGAEIGATEGWYAGFTGTFDGCGYTVSNFTVNTRGGVFGSVKGATIKNVTFDKVGYLYATATYGASLLGRTVSGNAKLENVTVNVASWSNAGNINGGVLFASATQDVTFTNVAVNVADNLSITTQFFGNGFNETTATGDITVTLGAGASVAYWYKNTGSVQVTDAANLSALFTVAGARAAVTETLDTLVAGEGSTTVTFEHAAFADCTSATVVINGTTVNDVAISGGKLTVDLASYGVTAMGQYEAIITTDHGDELTYTEVWYVTKVLKTVDDLAHLNVGNAVHVKDGYYILGNDIDCNGANIGGATTTNEHNLWGNGFKGTFNGRGYAIKNATTTGYGIFGAIDGTIKNVKFEQITFAANAALFARTIGVSSRATLENVTIDIVGWNSASTDGSVFGRSRTNQVTYTNVVINVADGITITKLFGGTDNAAQNNGNLTVNLGAGSSIALYFADATKPDFVTINTSSSEPVVETIDTLVAGENATSVTFTHSAINAGNADVTINGQTKTVTAAAGSVTVDLADFGISAMGQIANGAVIKSGTNELTYTEVWYVTQVIDDAAELRAFSSACGAANYTTGYYILGGNIDCSGQANMAAGNPGWEAYGFAGTFNGRNKTISNIKMTWDNPTGGYGGLFGNLAGCTIQNVVFDAVNYASTNVALLGRHSFAYGGNNVNLSNVTINVSAWVPTSSQEAGVLCSKNVRNTVSSGVVVNVAAGLNVSRLIGDSCLSISHVNMTVNLGTGSTITYYYGTTTAKPATVTVNTALAARLALRSPNGLRAAVAV